MNLLVVGLLFVAGGGALAWYHLGRLIQTNTKNKGVYVPFALLGGVAISIGANLIATSIHNRMGIGE